MNSVAKRSGFVLRVLFPLGLVFAGCGDENPVGPVVVPDVSYRPLATLPGQLCVGSPWSPLGKRLVYQSSMQSIHDLYVYDAHQPDSPPLLVHSGDYAWNVSWSPDAEWLLCVTASEWDRQQHTGLTSLVALPVTAGATPRVLVSRSDVGWCVWGANGKIYYWDWATGQRHRLEPPAEWAASNPGPFPDRPTIIYVRHPGPAKELGPSWFHTFPEEVVRFDCRNPGQAEDFNLVYDVFPNGLRFLASVPTYCGYSAVVDRHGKVLQWLWSLCDEPPFQAEAVTSDGRFIVGICDLDGDDWVGSTVPYLADAWGRWRVRIEGAPPGWNTALSRAGYCLAHQPLAERGVYVGELMFETGGK